jgi:hypothetical protein
MGVCSNCDGASKVHPSARYPNAEYPCQNCFGSGTDTLLIEYAGIGSRNTPNTVIAQMKLIGAVLAARGFVLRSGCAPRPADPKKRRENCDSADLAFEDGAKSVNGRVYLRVSTLWQPAMTHASVFHPNWEACKNGARGLHARNSLIMLRDTLDRAVRFVVCYTDGGTVTGGTGQALRIAAAYAIPVFNFGNPTCGDFWSWLAELGL